MARGRVRVRYLRDAKGRYNGSVGLGAPTPNKQEASKIVETKFRKIRELRRSLKPDQLGRLDAVVERKAKGKPKPKPSAAPPPVEHPPEVAPVVPTEPVKRKKKEPSPEDLAKKQADAEAKLAAKEAKKTAQEAAKQLKEIYKTHAKNRKLKNAAQRIADGKGKPTDQSDLEAVGIKSHKDFLASLAKKKRSNADNRIPPNFDHLDLSGTKSELWVGTDHGKPKEGFKIRKEKQSYGVDMPDGTHVVLNNIPQVATYKGERIRGVPSTNQYLRQHSNEELMKKLAQQMGYAESWDKKAVPAPAPYWDSNKYGKVPDHLKPDKGYGNMELHHVNQWYKHDVSKMKQDLASGAITPDEAKRLMRENLRENEKHSKGWEIAPAAQSQREYIVLAAGAHNATAGKKLYRENHPMGLHPETLKEMEFGIPDKNKGSNFGVIDGRQYHDGIRNGFWSEYSRRQALILNGELNRRLAKGEITKEEAQTHWANLKETARIKEEKKAAEKKAAKEAKAAGVAV